MLPMKIPARVLAASLFLLLVGASPGITQESPSEQLPVGAKARLGRGSVQSMQYSPDGTRLAVGSSVGIWLYDTQTYEVKSLFTGHTRQSRRTNLGQWQQRQDYPTVGRSHRHPTAYPGRSYRRRRQPGLQFRQQDLGQRRQPQHHSPVGCGHRHLATLPTRP